MECGSVDHEPAPPTPDRSSPLAGPRGGVCVFRGSKGPVPQQVPLAPSSNGLLPTPRTLRRHAQPWRPCRRRRVRSCGSIASLQDSPPVPFPGHHPTSRLIDPTGAEITTRGHNHAISAVGFRWPRSRDCEASAAVEGWATGSAWPARPRCYNPAPRLTRRAMSSA